MNPLHLEAAYEFAQRVDELRGLWNDSDADEHAVANAAGELIEMFEDVNTHELTVLGVHLVRLIAGRRSIGPMNLDRDPRDFRGEALEESIDLASWSAMGLVREWLNEALSARDGEGVPAPPASSSLGAGAGQVTPGAAASGGDAGGNGDGSPLAAPAASGMRLFVCPNCGRSSRWSVETERGAVCLGCVEGVGLST